MYCFRPKTQRTSAFLAPRGSLRTLGRRNGGRPLLRACTDPAGDRTRVPLPTRVFGAPKAGSGRRHLSLDPPTGLGSCSVLGRRGGGGAGEPPVCPAFPLWSRSSGRARLVRSLWRRV